MSTPLRSIIVVCAALLSGCRSTGRAEVAIAPLSSSEGACACASSAARPGPVADPFAPVLVPGPDRPRAMQTAVLTGLGGVSSAVPFHDPDSGHPRGTLLLGVVPESGPAEIIEVDIAKQRAFAVHRLPSRAEDVRIAATAAGVIVALNNPSDSPEEDRVLVLNDALEIQTTLKVQGFGTNVHADGKLAVVASDRRGNHGSQLIALELPSGKVLGKRNISGELTNEPVPFAQVLVHDTRIYALSHSPRHYELSSFSADLARRLGARKIERTHSWREDPSGRFPPTDATTLAAEPNGILMSSDDSLDDYDWDLQPNLPVWRISHSRVLPAVDPGSGRVLFPTGEGAENLHANQSDLVIAFRHDIWFGRSDDPPHYSEPVAAFFVSGRGVIVTQFPEVRVTVLEWSSQ